ncbi:MAG TPA: hypothetical protein ENJ17_01820 [Gammaproteobacteria bacterium]|nr:hypothetical protein [Gammaproteobacteria bacterium]
MIQGSIHLTLMMGPVVPLPVPRVVVDALQSVSVTSATGSASGFQLEFSFNSSSQLNTLFLIAPALTSSVATPPLRILLIVTINGIPTPLFDGIMTRAQVQPGQNGNAGTVSITGDDLTRVMDTQAFDGLPYPAMPIAARVALICAKYAAYGIIPLPIPEIFVDVPIPVDKIPAQQGTDLEYIQQLAEEVGHVFYIEPGPAPGSNVAYFGPEIKVGVPQPALNVDMGPHTNVESLTFSFDPSKGVLPIVYIQNQQTRVPIPLPIPDLNPLQPPLGAIPTSISNMKLLKDTAKMSPGKALSKGLKEAAKSQDSVTAQGSLDVLRYGRLLKARQLVGVRGVGMAYDGLYFVKSVTHKLKAGEFKQDFELTRNGLVSLTPVVPA